MPLGTLGHECPLCNRGKRRGDYCTGCDGTGFVMSDIGRELAHFLERHYGLKTKPRWELDKDQE